MVFLEVLRSADFTADDQASTTVRRRELVFVGSAHDSKARVQATDVDFSERDSFNEGWSRSGQYTHFALTEAGRTSASAPTLISQLGYGD